MLSFTSKYFNSFFLVSSLFFLFACQEEIPENAIIRHPSVQDLQKPPKEVLKVLNDINTTGVNMLLYNYTRAKLYFELHNIEKAEEVLTKNLQSKTPHSYSYALATRINIQKGNYEKAKHDINTTLNLGLKTPTTFLLKAQVHYKLKEYNTALFYIDKVMKEYADYFNVSSKSMPQVADSTATHTKLAMLRQSNSPHAAAELALYYLELRMKSYFDALKQTEGIKDEKLIDRVLSLRLSQAYYSIGKKYDATQVLEDYYSTHKNDLEIAQQLTQMYLSAKRYQKAAITYLIMEKTDSTATETRIIKEIINKYKASL